METSVSCDAPFSEAAQMPAPYPGQKKRRRSLVSGRGVSVLVLVVYQGYFFSAWISTSSTCFISSVSRLLFTTAQYTMMTPRIATPRPMGQFVARFVSQPAGVVAVVSG